MGCCSNKPKETNFPYNLNVNDMKFTNFSSTITNGNEKYIKLLINFNRQIKRFKPLENIPKLFNIVKQKGYKIEYAYQENNPKDNNNIIISIIYEDHMNFIIYSNFGKYSGLETIHGELPQKINEIADLIIKKYEENINRKNIPLKEQENALDIGKSYKYENKPFTKGFETVGQLFSGMRNDHIIDNINEVQRI